MTDAVNHPPHYTAHPSGVECIQITEHMGFCLGNAVKYIWRADLKGDAIEDLRKARWCIDREIERREAARAPKGLETARDGFEPFRFAGTYELVSKSGRPITAALRLMPGDELDWEAHTIGLGLADYRVVANTPEARVREMDL